MDFFKFDLKQIEIFLMILFRVCGLFALLPIFGAKTVKKSLRYGFCLFFAFILFPLLSQNVNVVPINNIIGLGLFLVKELMIGLLLSFISTIIFVAVRFAGEQIGRQMGVGMARIFDPTLDVQTNVVVQFMYLLAVLIFMALNGHHLLVNAVVKSFEYIPMGGFEYNEFIHTKVVDFVSYIFIYGVKIAAPILVMVFIATLSLGIMAKTAPEMNVLMIGFPLKIFMGLMGISLTLPLFSYILRGFFIKMNNEMFEMMKSMNM